MNRCADALVGAASAQIGHSLINVGVGGFGFSFQEGCGCHEHAALAVTALGHLFGDPGRLQRVRLFCRAQGLDGFDRLIGHSRHGHHARAHGLAAHMHRAGPASGDAAAELGAREVEFIPQYPEQGHAGVGGRGAALAVDVQLHSDLQK